MPDAMAAAGGERKPAEGPCLLIVAPDCPFPPYHGGRAAVYDNIFRFISMGYEVDLLFTSKTAPDAESMDHLATLCRQVIHVARVNRLTDFLHREGLQIRSRKRLADVALPWRYDLVCLEGPYVAAALENPVISGAKYLLRWHNDEPAYFRNLARAVRSPFAKLYYLVEALRMQRVQEQLMRESVGILVISSKELERIQRREGVAPACYVPVRSIADATAQRPLPSSKTVLFVGSLFMPNNLAAVRWYLDHVHPRLSDVPGYVFRVAGRLNADDDPRSLSWISDAGQVELMISPQSLDDIYASAALFVNPAQEEAGVKVKNYEAAAYGLPIVSTPHGIAGSSFVPGMDVLASDDPKTFAEFIRALLADPARGAAISANARARLASDGDLMTVKQFLDAVT